MKVIIKYLLISLLAINVLGNAYSQPVLHSDKIDVLHYNINLEISDFTNQTISGFTELTIVPKVSNLQSIELDLLAFFIDSITVDSVYLPFWDYNDTLLIMPLLQTYGTDDTLKVAVFYYGHPQQDPGIDGWGGFKWTSNSAYNLGVGFEAIPHNFGRCWYPCIDDFIDRAAYDFYIRVDGALNHSAVCNGLLMDVDSNICTNKRTFHWRMSAEIPTYLASVAVGSYVAVKDTFISPHGPVPIEIWARPADSLKAVNSFANLKAITQLFVDKFGDYLWERIGYVGVDFNAGAMEHATNIAVPNLCITGNTAYEKLFAHELSHHWFGNLATCRTAQDMWLNEGFATFCEMVYDEAFSGYNTFLTNKRNMLSKVLRYNHIEEGGFVTLNQVPDSITYGSTSYEKGGLVAHTLRSYLGNSMFYNAITAFLNLYKFKDATSEQLRDFLTGYTGSDMAGFFNNWVFSPGFPHFSVDSFVAAPNGPDYDVTVYCREKLRGRTDYSDDNLVEITFMGISWQQSTQIINISGGYGQAVFTLPFQPVCAMIDLYEKTDDATCDNYKIIKNTGSIGFSQTYFTGYVTSLPDSAFLRVEHNWVAPDEFVTPIPGILISRERYWKIDGIVPSGFNTKGKFYFSSQTGSSGYLDIQLINNHVDSLVLLYRKGPGHNWEIYPSYRTGTTSAGYLNTDTTLLGEYSLGIRNWAVYNSVGSLYNSSGNKIKIMPNPANNFITIIYDFETGDKVCITDLSGKTKMPCIKSDSSAELIIPVSDLGNGLYLITIERKSKRIETARFLISD